MRFWFDKLIYPAAIVADQVHVAIGGCVSGRMGVDVCENGKRKSKKSGRRKMTGLIRVPEKAHSRPSRGRLSHHLGDLIHCRKLCSLSDRHHRFDVLDCTHGCIRIADLIPWKESPR